jgi:YHS domain-containing protein
MKRNLVIFLATFAFGALIAFAARAALHQPHSAATAHAHVSPEHAAMVNNALTPAADTVVGGGAEHAGHTMTATATRSSAAAATADVNSDHQNHVAKAEPAAAPGTVNTKCAICGMPVDPNLPTAEYLGKKIGFGCKMCAPKFKANPDKYGPAYLRNEVIKH